MSMRKRIVALTAGVAVVAAVALVMVGRGPSFDDPADAQCASPAVTFGEPTDFGDHREIAVSYPCEGAVQRGTLYLPVEQERFPVVIWVHGAGEAARLPFAAPIVSGFVGKGIGFFSFDKRGVGRSEGECCPGDYGHFNLLTADVVGAIDAVRGAAGVDATRVGLIGASQAGWIAPRAAAESGHVAFLALASPGILPYDEVSAYAQLTGGDESDQPLPTREEIADALRDASRGGTDPRPFLERLPAPSLFLLAGADQEVPFDQTITLLDQLKGEGGDITVVPFPNAGHGLLNVPSTDPDALPTLITWVTHVVGAT